MKKIFIPIFLSFFNSLYFSQTVNDKFKNEIKANVFLEVSYERLLRNNFSLGVFGMKNYIKNLNMDFMFSPYARYYFGKKDHGGFFVDLHGGYVNRKKESIEDTTYKESTFGMGFSLGNKFLFRNNFTGEIFVGVGDQVGNKVEYGKLIGGFELFYPRLGIVAGYRF